MNRSGRALLAGAALVLLGTTACSSGSSPAPLRSTGTGQCTLSATLVPSCGALWGISTQPKSITALDALQKEVDRPFELVYNYHDITQPIPTDEERRLASEGKILHLSIAARVYGDSRPVTYASIARGDHDASLRRQAEGLASLKVPVFVTFEQEGNQQRKLGTRGDAADYKAAWRHVHDVYRAAGATNAIWVWVMTGRPENLSRAGSIWPGNDYVDWISWNVYNQSGCHSGEIKPHAYRSFAQRLKPFYDWVHQKGPSFGIDPHKPMMISESGSVLYRDDPQRTADWYRAIPGVLKQYPQVKAITLWDSKTSDACDYRFRENRTVLKGVIDAGASPWLNVNTSILKDGKES